ncbi:metallophosphoesterase [Formosa sp. 4Alg 33]|uniref:metallophosphoesterase n=1 Tax=Formosa sp. 4Alg 33 TaxID=3382189 RepID=UPI003D9C0693
MIKKSVLIVIMLFSVYSFSQTSETEIIRTSASHDSDTIGVSEHSTSVVVVRGPYIQNGTPTSVILKWRTDKATESVVHYGTTPDALQESVTQADLKMDHEITLTGLEPMTKYYFNVGNKKEVLSESVNGDMYVVTSPIAGTSQFVRAWIIGDPGTANDNQRQVRDAYYNYVELDTVHEDKTDLLLFLGDNAYNTGTDLEYQNAFFNVYNDIFKKVVSWSCLGNHDGESSDSKTQSGPYFDIFSFPTKGEAGGTASGTEAYYSFDYANIHFIILDSHHSSREVGGSQYNWAKTDIQNTTQDWIVTLFHHPAYSKGSHDSDYEGRLIDMRENIMPMLEANGVDLVLNGHSHSYERSYFLNGHHGFSNTFNSDEINKGGHTVGKTGYGDGKPNGDGAYTKAIDAAVGTVYITTGSAGQVSGGDLNHQAMFVSLNELGSCVMEIENDGKGGQNLNLKFLRETGEIDDYFTINKTDILLEQNDKSSVLIPINDMLNLKISDDERLKKVEFYNNLGKKVKKTKDESVNVSDLISGTYVVKIKTNKKTVYKSVLID